MSEELKLHIKKLQNRATLSLIALLVAIVSLGLGFACLFAPSFWAIIFFALAIFCILYLIYTNIVAKKEHKNTSAEPIIFDLSDDFSFQKLICIFENLTDSKNRIALSNDVYFFRFKNKLKTRAVIYKTLDFDKNDFANAKKRINKKANKELNISQWVSLVDSGDMQRLNIIYSDCLNNRLYNLLSQNAATNLSRVEGVINIAIVKNQIFIPPIYGECDLGEIKRYKDIVSFIDRMLLSK